MTTVPIIYDLSSKQILRWYILDSNKQLLDPAFNPQNPGEGILRVDISIYRALAGMDPALPLLHKLQDYVNGNAP